MLRTIWLVALVGCTGSEEAAKIMLPVATSAGALPTVTTDLGYEIALAQVRIAVTGVQFTIEGEMHADVVARGAPPAPHPGHSAGGEVTGELPGEHVLVWNGGMGSLGTGTLIVGEYRGANFALRAATASDGLSADDKLLGHTFHLVGTITRDAMTRPFEAVLDVEPDSAVVGAFFEGVITESSTETLGIVFYPADPFENDTPFDGVDFFQLPDSASAVSIEPGSEAHNLIRRAIQTHDHYAVVLQ